MNTLTKSLTLLFVLVAAGCGDSKKQLRGGPPPEPTNLAQYQDVETRLPWGGVTGEKTVLFKGTVGANPTNVPVRLHVELVPLGTPFTGQPSGTSDYVPSGEVAQVVGPVPASGDYAWRAWAEDTFQRSSGYVSYSAGAGPAFTADFSAPTSPAQLKIDSVTWLGIGEKTPEVGVLLRAWPQSPAGNIVRAQFEVKPTNVPFDGSSPTLGSFVTPGQASSAIVLLPIGTYQWRARTEDYAGTTSLWVGFGGNDDLVPTATDFERIAGTTETTPNLPGNLQQLHTDGVTAIPNGGTTTEDKVVLTGIVSSPSLLPCALEVEVKPLGVAFDGTGTTAGSYVGDGDTSKAVFFASAGSFQWRARAVDSLGACSTWALFNTYGGALPDFVDSPSINNPPAIPTNLQQFQSDGVTGMSAGDPIQGGGMIVKAQLSDADFGDGLALEVEVKPVGTSFSGIPSAASLVVPSGQVATITVSGSPGSAYHWQARAIDEAGAASLWIEYTGSTPTAVAPPGGGGGSSGGGSIGGGGSGCSASISVRPGTTTLSWALALAALVCGLWPHRRSPRSGRILDRQACDEGVRNSF